MAFVFLICCLLKLKMALGRSYDGVYIRKIMYFPFDKHSEIWVGLGSNDL